MYKTCSNCKFFLRQKGYDAGQCRRNPPTVVWRAEKESSDCNPDFANIHPYVGKYEWCGEHKIGKPNV